MSLVTREFKIIYGSITLGAGTSYIIDGTDPIQLSKNYGVASVTATIIVTGATETAFNTNCTTLEAAFRVPRATLQVILGSTTMWDYNATNNTGFNARPNISKPGSKHDTGRSRRYTISVEVDLPADLAGQNGRVMSSVNLTETDSRRLRLIVSGSYTALNSNTARGQYLASIDTYCSSLISGFGGTWEGPFDIKAEADDANKLLNFSRTYEKLIYDQSSGTLDNTWIRRQSININVLQEGPGDSKPGSFAHRLATVTADYEAAIDSTLTQDLENVWLTVVKPWLLENVRSAAGSNGIALISQRVNFDWAENRISANLICLAAASGGLISINISTKDTHDKGIILIPVWNKERFSKHEFQGPASIIRVITTISRTLDGSSGQRNSSSTPTDPLGIFAINTPLALDFGSGDNGGGSNTSSEISNESVPKDPAASPDGGELIGRVLSTETTTTRLVLGIPSEPQMNVTDEVTVSTLAFFVQAKKASG